MRATSTIVTLLAMACAPPDDETPVEALEREAQTSGLALAGLHASLTTPGDEISVEFRILDLADHLTSMVLTADASAVGAQARSSARSASEGEGLTLGDGSVCLTRTSGSGGLHALYEASFALDPDGLLEGTLRAVYTIEPPMRGTSTAFDAVFTGLDAVYVEDPGPGDPAGLLGGTYIVAWERGDRSGAIDVSFDGTDTPTVELR